MVTSPHEEILEMLDNIHVGTLTMEELREACESLGLPPSDKDTEADLVGLIEMLIRG